MNPLLDIVGLLAGLLTTIAFVPQVWKIYRTKSGRDISARMFSIFSIGIVLWLVYGFMLGQLPIILANAVTLVLSLTIIGLKVYYSRANARTGN
ncbi:MAG TPA: SemiSWEET transporter [Burkholderiales bacterium]|nr:SemiSWEET transporter [Burkholderiales bacterium]